MYRQLQPMTLQCLVFGVSCAWYHLLCLFLHFWCQFPQIPQNTKLLPPFSLVISLNIPVLSTPSISYFKKRRVSWKIVIRRYQKLKEVIAVTSPLFFQNKKKRIYRIVTSQVFCFFSTYCEQIISFTHILQKVRWLYFLRYYI